MYSEVLFIQQFSANSDARASVDGDSSVASPEQIGSDAACWWRKERSDAVCWCSLLQSSDLSLLLWGRSR